MKLTNNSASTSTVQISVVLNKSKRERKGSMLAFLHNGVIKCRKDDEDIQWIEFRLLGTDKEGNVTKSPMFATQGRKEVAVDSEKFLTSLYGTSEVDIRFTFDMKSADTDELLDSGKALKISFGLADLKEEGETEYQEQWTKKVRVLNATVEVLDSYHGIGRTIDPEALAAALEVAASPSKSQYVQTQELHESADKLVNKSRNAKRKDRKREERAASLLQGTQKTVAIDAVTTPIIKVAVESESITEAEFNQCMGADANDEIGEGKEIDELDSFTMDLLGLG